MTKNFIRSFLSASLNLLFPPSCPSCMVLTGQGTGYLCEDCLARLQLITPPFCTCCGTPLNLGDNRLCLTCLDSPLPFQARSCFLYQEPISTLTRQVKFTGNLTGLRSLAALARETPAFQNLNKPDLILPVPLHIQRLRERGFNQSLLLTRACFPEWKPLIRFDILKRQRSTIPQTRLSGKARRNNLHKAFAVASPHLVQGKQILLVDDVLTTGSTLKECAKILLEAGAVEITAFTIARSGVTG
ncbi:MAG: ComF family protein [Candidatus Electrothrix aestuarii]|uniref:ComF family protein n=1 Tax=Candidatus Electrothrix aestuarii TaxID=3062594 RepID=A0AAU8LYW9_9BACT|nr:ComF family protein [Candidatus Electrothrix aestuarii]